MKSINDGRIILIIMFCGLGEVRLLEKEPYSVGEEALGDFGIYWRGDLRLEYRLGCLRTDLGAYSTRTFKNS